MRKIFLVVFLGNTRPLKEVILVYPTLGSAREGVPLPATCGLHSARKGVQSEGTPSNERSVGLRLLLEHLDPTLNVAGLGLCYHARV